MRPTSTEDLRMLTAVDAHGSLTAAAAALGVSQQAVSQRMRALERRWGIALVERSARGTRLTELGTVVNEWAGAVLARSDAFDSAVLALRGDTSARLRIAASLTVAEHLMPGWLVTYGEQDGAARVELIAVNSASVIERVRAGTDDLGFVERPDVPDDLARLHLARDALVIVVAPGDRWAREGRITPDALASRPLVSREAGSGTRRTLELGLGALAHTLAEPAAELSTTSSIRAMVGAGGGAAVLSELAVRDDLASGRLVRVEVDGVTFDRPLTAVWRRDVRLPVAAEGFLGVATGRSGRRANGSEK